MVVVVVLILGADLESVMVFSPAAEAVTAPSHEQHKTSDRAAGTVAATTRTVREPMTTMTHALMR